MNSHCFVLRKFSRVLQLNISYQQDITQRKESLSKEATQYLIFHFSKMEFIKAYHPQMRQFHPPEEHPYNTHLVFPKNSLFVLCRNIGSCFLTEHLAIA